MKSFRKELNSVHSFIDFFDLLIFSPNLKKGDVVDTICNFLTGDHYFVPDVKNNSIRIFNDKINGFKVLVFVFINEDINRVDYLQFAGIDNLLALENYIIDKFDYKTTIDQISRDNNFITVFKSKMPSNFSNLEVISKSEVFLNKQLKLDRDEICSIRIRF